MKSFEIRGSKIVNVTMPDEFECNSGVYCIVVDNYFIYIGSSRNLHNRLNSWKQLIGGLSLGVCSGYMSWILSKCQTVRFEIVEFVENVENLETIEYQYIGLMNYYITHSKSFDLLNMRLIMPIRKIKEIRPIKWERLRSVSQFVG